MLHEHGSVAETLLEHATQTDADALIVGSPHGTPGRFSLGSTANVLLHRSPIPVGMAPEGYDPPPGTRLSRVSVGISGGPSERSALQLGATLARADGVPLRLVTLQVSDAGMAIPVVGFDTEGIVDTEWKADLEAMHHTVLESLPDDVEATSVVTRRPTWHDALDALEPLDGELLVIGGSPHSLLRHVFLGTHGNKIVRASSMPVIVAPAGSES